MTPYQLAILLHYYAKCDDWPHHAPILEETLQGFVRDGLLEPAPFDPDDFGPPVRFRDTEKLRCYIDHICALPLPRWTMNVEAA